MVSTSSGLIAPLVVSTHLHAQTPQIRAHVHTTTFACHRLVSDGLQCLPHRVMLTRSSFASRSRTRPLKPSCDRILFIDHMFMLYYSTLERGLLQFAGAPAMLMLCRPMCCDSASIRYISEHVWSQRYTEGSEVRTSFTLYEEDNSQCTCTAIYSLSAQRTDATRSHYRSLPSIHYTSSAICVGISITMHVPPCLFYCAQRRI